MAIKSRWEIPIPRCSLQQWIFGSSRDPLPDRPAFVDADRPETHRLSCEEHRLLAKRVALGLRDAGLGAGDRVLVYAGNSLYFPSVFLGVMMAGGVFTGANPGFTARELTHQLRDSAAAFVLAAGESLDTAFRAAEAVGMPRRRVYVFDAAGDHPPRGEHPSPGAAGGRGGARHWTQLLAGNGARARRWDWVEPPDPDGATCCLNYSSGTTGVPKGVEISHGAYVANGAGVVHVGAQDPEAALQRARDRVLCFLPLYHAYAQTTFIANYPHLGVPVYVMPRFDLEKMLQHVQRFRITALSCVPPVVVALAKDPLVREYDLSSLELIGSGAAPLPLEAGAEAGKRVRERREGREGREVSVVQGWGMSEVTCTCLSWEPARTRALAARGPVAGVGELMPNCAARLVAPDGGEEILEAGRPGELWVTGPTLMRGYWGRAEATEQAVVVDADGTRWLRTGDVAYVDEYAPGGIFHVVDRLKELIKVKGNQVAPAELEALLLERPDVVDAAVVGVTIKGEELPRAYVVKAQDATVSEIAIAEWVKEKVVGYKQLKGGVVFVDNIPKNPSGKILRKILRERAEQEVGDSKPREARLT